MSDQLMSVSCEPECGFKVQSHDREELRMIVKEHGMDKHGMDMSDEDINMKMEMVE